jgi:hypothetical protein
MPELAHAIKNYQPQPDPLAEKARELEVAKLEAEVMNERAKAEENTIDRELKAAKTQTELMQAKAMKSKADLDDLTFLEREKGIDHNKELQKQQQKIEGDLMKERAKSLKKAANG